MADDPQQHQDSSRLMKDGKAAKDRNWLVRSVDISGRRTIGRGYRDYERFSVLLKDDRGGSSAFDRDVLRCGPVVGVLPVDPELDQLVLTRQFRLGAYLATGEHSTLEIVAGRCDPTEKVEQAARRECLEEIGVGPTRLVPILELMPAPAWSDELMMLFLAGIDARRLPSFAGVAHEQEEIEVVSCKIDEAIELVAENAVHSGPSIIALQWLKLNRELIPTLLEA
jgi:ADP-ribose pyrophosphatase